MDITTKQMMQIEENGHKMGFSRKLMMENAGASVVKILINRFVDISSKDIIVFAGLGNNGGDALVAARHLVCHDANVMVILLGDPKMIKTEESRSNWNIINRMTTLQIINDNIENINLKHDIIIDGILGTGIHGNINEPYSSAIEFINKSNALTLSVDVPTGIDPDDGSTGNIYVKPDITVTFHKIKVGMKKTNICGLICVEKIGIPPEAEIGVT